MVMVNSGMHRVSVNANPFSMSEMSPPGASPGSPRFTTEYGDMIISRSTIPEYVSFRNPDLGSWFIQYICEVSTKRYKRKIVKIIKTFNSF